MRKIKFEIKTVSEANQREHWGAKLKRKKQQQHDFGVLWKSKRPNVPIPARITFTRYSCGVMDSDNLAGSFKHIRDELCRQIYMDDGDDRLMFEYRQEKIKTRDHWFTVEIAGQSAP